MGFTNTEPQSHESENTWFTPEEFIDALGPFDLDPCTVSYAPFETAWVMGHHDQGYCGIKEAWKGDVWLNPPYGKQIRPFIEKFKRHKEGVMLIFARMGSEGVQDLIKSGAYIYCLRKRVFFLNKEGQKVTNAGTDSCLVFYDPKFISRCKSFDGVLIQGVRT